MFPPSGSDSKRLVVNADARGRNVAPLCSSCTSLYGRDVRETVCSRPVSNNEAALHVAGSKTQREMTCLLLRWCLLSVTNTPASFKVAAVKHKQLGQLLNFQLKVYLRKCLLYVSTHRLWWVQLLQIFLTPSFQVFTLKPCSVETKKSKYREGGG